VTRSAIGRTAEWTNKVEAADIDVDGDVDLLFANGGEYEHAGRPEASRVFLNHGDATFTEATRQVFGGMVGALEGLLVGRLVPTLREPSWQDSRDTSAVWGLPIASSSDPAFVAPDAIPWLLVEAFVVGDGPTGGTRLVITRYIQRVNTAGGLAPSDGCATPGELKKRALVPYEADYVFYREKRTNRRD